MTDLQLIIIALVQGATEWLPISSSAHLILIPQLTGLPDQGPLIDAAAHLGSLGALLAYFWRDVGRVIRGGIDLVAPRVVEGERRRLTADARLFLLIAIAAPPGLLVGLFFEATNLNEAVRQTWVIALASIVFGVALWAADAFRPSGRSERDLTWRDGLFVGLAQAVAFIPGASRSGMAMTAARLLGLERGEAARFAMLAGVPLIAAVGGYALLQLALGEPAGATGPDGEPIPVTLRDGVLVAGLSFLAAYASIWALMALLKRISFAPFALYRVVLGVALLFRA